MTQHVLVIGSTGGVGSACCAMLKQDVRYGLTAWNSTDLDFNFPDRIFEKDMSMFDIVINCAAHNQGTYKGFLKNTWQNQLSQIMVNYASNLFLVKHYANSRISGKYIWCSTDTSSGITPFKSVYLSTKIGSQFAMNLIRQEVQHIFITETQFPAVRSNLRYRNFEGTLTLEQIENTYDTEPLSVEYVAGHIMTAVNNNIEKMVIE